MNFEILSKYKTTLRTSRIGSKTYLFDKIRKKNIVVTPEELTRQLIIEYLIQEKNYRPALIQVEKAIYVNGLMKRYDIITFDRSFNPYLLVECKSHRIKLDQSVLDQVARYNLSLKVPYILITNGIDFFCYQMDYVNHSHTLLTEVPLFTQI